MTHVEPTKTKPTKAIVSATLTAVSGIALGIEQLIPDPTVKMVCQVITLVVGVVTSAFAVFLTTNAPAAD